MNIRNLAKRLLTSLQASPTPSFTPTSAIGLAPDPPHTGESNFHIGFITPPFKDNKIPVTDHLHAHAYIAPGDLMGWWRGIAYSPVAWYAVDDLIAEIRYVMNPCVRLWLYWRRYSESVSNNRIKSGYNRPAAPIDMVADAGARMGTANGIEVTDAGLGVPDVEAGETLPGSSRRSSNLLSPQTPISSLQG